jgi:hypothetical protein
LDPFLNPIALLGGTWLLQNIGILVFKKRPSSEKNKNKKAIIVYCVISDHLLLQAIAPKGYEQPAAAMSSDTLPHAM